MNSNQSLDVFTSLAERYRYRDAMLGAQDAFGPYRAWEQPELRFLAVRCLYHLARPRTADALVWHLARAGFDTPQFACYHLRNIQQRQGGLASWEASQQYDLSGFEPADAARLLCERAEIAAFYRDFQRAEALLDDAARHDENRSVEFHRINLLYLQDEYEPALERAQNLLGKEPDYRPAIQLAAQLYQLTGETEQALAALEAVAFDLQSIPLLQQLFYFCLEARAYAQAERCIAGVEGLLLDDERSSLRTPNAMKSDWLCAQQKYEEAVPFLELVAPYQHRVSETIRQKREAIASQALRRKLLDIPFVRQKHKTCAPASISAVTHYLGHPVDQETVANDITYDGTPSFEERRWLQEHGWIPVEFELTYDSIKALIDADYPVLLSTVEPGNAHLQVLAGYDENMDILILRDPHYPRLQEMLAQESIDYYSADGPRCLVLANSDQLPELAAMQLKARELYDLYFKFNRALGDHDRGSAAGLIAVMEKQSPGHRLTFEARRYLAFYDRDEAQMLSMTESLLEMFPHNINLQLSKIESLAFLYSADRKMAYLEELFAQPDCHFLVQSRLAQELRFDDRQFARAERLLLKLLQRDSLHAPTLYAYAGLLWAQRRFEPSYEIYRFLTCLEDKHEVYAESYFKASRYCEQTDEAIAFLYDRFERHGTRSSGPAISLFNALNSIHRTEEGLGVLDTAIERLPGDGDLLLFTAREQLYVGNFNKCRELMAQAESKVKRTRYLELSAQADEFRQAHDAAIQSLREVLQIEPLNADAATNLVRLLQERGDIAAAGDFIDSQLAAYPHNYNLLRLKTDWADKQDAETRIEAYRSLLRFHPDQTWAYLQLARIYLEQLQTEQALDCVTEALEAQSSDAQTHCVLGHVYRAQDKAAEASQAYRRAIELSCDLTEAYQPLVDLALDNASQQQELRFIYDQLLQQVTYGEALLAFQRIARNWLDYDELLQILQEANAARPDLVHSWVALAIEFRERDELDSALSTLDQASERFPLIPKIRFEQAEIYRLLGELPKAEQQLREVLELSPTWSSAGTRLADVQEAQGHQEQAIATLQNLIHAVPLDAVPHGYLASLHWRMGNPEAALESIRRAIDIAPEYTWAWNSYNDWCRELDRQEAVVEKLRALRDRMPANADLVITQVRMLGDPASSLAELEQFLQSYPRDVDVAIEYIKLLVQERRFDEALVACSEARWGQKIPLSILASRAWIRSVQGYADDAIAAMQSVVEANPNYYDGWRLLSNWFADKGDPENVCACIEQCLRIYPNDPAVLCFAAEKFRDHDSANETRIKSLLKRAFYLDPSEQYAALTYIDYLIDCDDLEQAEAAIDILTRNTSNPFIAHRQLNLACRNGNSERALDLWRYIVSSDAGNAAVTSFAWQLLTGFDLATQAGQVIMEQREAGAYLVPIAGECLIYQIGEDRGIKEVERIMKAMPADPAPFDHRAIEGYLRTLIRTDRDIPKPVFNALQPHLRADTLNWGLLAYLKTDQGQTDFVVDWMQDFADRDGLEAWMLYFYSMALRHSGNWEDGVELTAIALELAHDDYFNDLVVWRAFDLALEGDYSVGRLLAQIQVDDLSPVSHFVYAQATCLNNLRDRSFNEAYDDLLPDLELCKAVASDGFGSRIAWEARKKAYFYLKQRIDAPFFESLIWRNKLGKFFK